MSESHLILGIGELLWDVLPEGLRLGGAPANFTVMAGRLGNHAAILSRVGRDELGQAAIELVDSLPVDASSVQIDSEQETGRVTVEFAEGQPGYTIHRPAAWDFMELSDDWVRLAARADAICFGSLAQRSEISRQTIQTLVAESRATCVRVFDVNLRAPFYSSEVLEESLELATVVKMNDAEVPLVLDLLDLEVRASERDAAADAATLSEGGARLLKEFPTLQLVAITRGGQGSVLVRREEWHEHPGVPAKLADTIGAGDAFTAAITHYLLQGASLAVLNEAGNRWGSWMASQSGAMPALPDETRKRIAAAIDAVD